MYTPNTVNTICYKLKEPIYYNKGTKWESSCDTFLLCYTYDDDIMAQAEVDRYNMERPTIHEKGINIDNIDYFFLNRQKAFDITGT